ncbi:Imm7 family immunity protein [Amycolatopsis anabasis]|uniref:Imm7 family immunity protein n=1 Tax=Amycolatopsis anabasis TaxID=1840409 RepID=UPI00131E356D|nr:Imm7 family immunity protein [Amycolatopsis anabasis]
MFEYHGWVAISETPGLDGDDALLNRAVKRVRRQLNDIGGDHLLDLRWMNGVPHVHLAGSPIRRGSWGEEIVELFNQIARLAPGSYGLLYVRDDDDPFQGNEFQVYRMARGQVTRHADPFLSPVVPTVEDGYPDD